MFKQFLTYFTLFLCIPLAASYHIVIVAGQSNSLNIHADARLCPESASDTLIPFFYDDYNVPNDTNVQFITNSGGEWVTLRVQKRDDLKISGRDYFNTFFGPEITLARTLSDHIDSVAIFKFVVPGSDLAQEWIGENGPQLLPKMLQRLSTAEEKMCDAGHTFNWTGFTWMQGESDAVRQDYASNYYRNLGRLIAVVRDSLNCPDMPFIIGRIADDLSPTIFPYRDAVRNAQRLYAKRHESAEMVETDSYEMDSDNLHFNAYGVMDLGYDMAQALLTFLIPETSTVCTEKHIFDMVIRPNPVNGRVCLDFETNNRLPLRIRIYNISGQNIWDYVMPVMSPGHQTLHLNTNDLVSGLYIVSAVHSDGQMAARGKILVMK